MIPFIDLKRLYKHEKKHIQKVVSQTLASGKYLDGLQAAKFEEEFASYLDLSEAITVSSGTDAITLALLALGIKSGDEVIIPANVYPSVFSILRSGATPLPCDINPHTFNLDLASLEKVHISKKTKVILFVHLYGNPAGIVEVAQFARQNNLFLIEDCAHAHGAKIGGKMVGSFGDLGCFSFYPTKNLGAFGNGGMIVTKSATLAEKIRFLKTNGEKKRFISQKIGLTSQLDEIQAALLRVKLKSLDQHNSMRKNLVNYYKKHLANLPIKIQLEENSVEHAYLNFVISTDKRDLLQSYLTNKEIGTQVHYPLPLHLQPSLEYLGYKSGNFPNSEKACQQVLSLPMYPYLKKEEVKLICQTIRNFLK